MSNQNAKNRYEKEYSIDNILNNEYSLINPVGEYDYYATTKILSWFVKEILKSGRKFTDISILDAGCGDGRKTRILAELLGSSKNIKSFELSPEGVAYCQRVNDSIECVVGDVVDDFPKYEKPFDAIMACSVFMFILEEWRIKTALNNIYDNLDKDGLFMWFDVNSSNHFDNENKRAEIGYNTTEMDKLASEAGFELVNSNSLFKNIKYKGNTTSTYYMYPKWGIGLSEMLNSISLFKPTFNARIYKKIT